MLFHSNINKIVLTLIIIGMMFMITACSRPLETKISVPEKQSEFHQESKAEEEEDTQIDLTDNTNSNSSDKPDKSLLAQEEEKNWGEQESDSSQSGDNKNISNEKENPENSEMSDNDKSSANSEIDNGEVPSFQTTTKIFKEKEGKTLTMSVDIPSNWVFRTDDPNAIDQYINDENGVKVAGSFGIVQFLKTEESFGALHNVAGFLTPVQTSSIITLNEREYLLETSTIGGSSQESTVAYHYSFVVDNAVINFYFYNIGDKTEHIALYEKVLKSINIEIN